MNDAGPALRDRYEAERVSALRDRGILDTPPDAILDTLTQLAARFFDVPIVWVSLLDDDRQWFKSKQGSNISETDRGISFCNTTIRRSDPLIVPDTTKDLRFRDNPLVTGDMNIRFYAGYPLVTSDGFTLGSFCLVDTAPHENVPEHQIEALRSFGMQTVEWIEKSYPRSGSVSPGPRYGAPGHLLRSIIDQMPVAVAMVDRELNYVAANSVWHDLYEVSDSTLIGKSHLDVAVNLTPARRKELIDNARRGTTEKGKEVRLRRSGESETWVRCDNHPWTGDDGSYGGLVLYRTLIEDTATARDEVRRSRERYKSIYKKTPAMMHTVDESGRIVRVSEHWLWAMGYSRSEVVGRLATDFMTEESAHFVSKALRPALLSSGQILEAPITFVKKDGTLFSTLLSGTSELHPDGRFRYGHAVVFDISEKERLKARLQDRETSYKTIYDKSPIMLHSIDAEGRLIRVSEFWLRRLGYSRENVIGRHLAEFMDENSAEFMQSFELNEFLKKGEVSGVPYTFQTKSGDDVEILLSAVAQYDNEGNYKESLAVLTDVTEINRLEKQASQSEGLIRSFLEHSPTFMYSKSLDGRYLLMNQAFRAANGLTSDHGEIRTTDLYDEDLVAIFAEMDREVQRSGKAVKSTLDVPDKDGNTRKMVVTKFPIRGDGNDIIGIGGVGLDISERQVAEEALRQAQKMDAVGNLTGGIAHDFNNILAVIMGNLQLLERMMPGDKKSTKRLDAALTATRRGADLTRQLLAFSRRQDLQPTDLDVNESIRNIHTMIQRTIADSITIDLKLGDFGALAHIDEGQLQTAILNLVINARDAMPQGGRLSIETDTIAMSEKSLGEIDGISPGDYISISVTDTGLGMPDDVKARVFEPFFTTKELGKGTGLGLAMVYGFIKQSGGHVSIYSELDKGTTIRLYLPISESAHSTKFHEEVPLGDLVTAGRILIVEDDAGVRSVVREMIEDLGFSTVEATSADEALTLLESDCDFDLVFSDIVMPGSMSGVDLTREIDARGYKFPVLLTSGYPRDALKFVKSVHILQKPYNQNKLAAEISTAIGRHRQS